MSCLRWLARLLAIAAASATIAAQAPDATRLLAQARQALGGDAALIV